MELLKEFRICRLDFPPHHLVHGLMLWTSGQATFLNTPWRFPKARQAAGQHPPGTPQEPDTAKAGGAGLLPRTAGPTDPV